MNTRGSVVLLFVGVLSLGVAACAEQSPAPPSPTSAGTTSTTAPQPPALPRAANGTDLGACTDGQCEIQVTADDSVEADPTLGVAGMHLGEIKDETVTVTLITPADAGLSIDIQGDDSATSSMTSQSGELSATMTAVADSGATLAANRLVINIVAVVQQTAVLRLTPA